MSVNKDSREFMNMLRTTRGGPMYQPNLSEINEMSKSIRNKIQTMLKEQTNTKVLNDMALPKVPKAYGGPLVASVNMGKN